MRQEDMFRDALSGAGERLFTVTEELTVTHEGIRTVGRSLLEGGAQEAGSHLYELAERVDELSLFAVALRSLIESAQNGDDDGFSRDSLRLRLKINKSSQR